MKQPKCTILQFSRLEVSHGSLLAKIKVSASSVPFWGLIQVLVELSSMCL